MAPVEAATGRSAFIRGHTPDRPVGPDFSSPQWWGLAIILLAALLCPEAKGKVPIGDLTVACKSSFKCPTPGLNFHGTRLFRLGHEDISRQGIFQHPAHPGQCHRPTARVVIFVTRVVMSVWRRPKRRLRRDRQGPWNEELFRIREGPRSYP